MLKKLSKILKWTEKYSKIDMAYIASGVLWHGIGRASALIISLITMIAFARWLPQENYGTYQFIIATLSFFVIFTLPGINTSIIKSIAQKKDGTLEFATKERIKWGLIGSFCSLALSVWYLVKGNLLLGGSFLLGALFLPFWPTYKIFMAFWNGRKRFDLLAKYDTILSAIAAIFLILTIYITDNVFIITFIFLASHTLIGKFFYQNALKNIQNQEKDKEAISFGKHLTAISAIGTLASSLDRIIIWEFLGASPVAIYSFALSPIQKLKDIIPINPLALPKLGEGKIDEKRKRKILLNFSQLFLIFVPATIILVILAPFAYKIFFPQYINSIAYFQGFAWLIALSPIILLRASLIAAAKEKPLYIINISGELLKIALFLFLIQPFGIWGIIGSILGSEIMKGFLILYFFLKI